MNANFIDYVKIYGRSGKGGAGSAHLRREKFVPRGGPDGGDGGRGGHVIVRGNSHLWTLLHLRYTRHVMAESGQSGGKQQRSGAGGKDAVIEVPLGTLVRDAESNEVLAEIVEHGESFIVLKGGRGGLGNTHFKSAVRQTPRYAQPGEDGEEKALIMELKILADVGLVGFPNAGKSTLLSVISAAKPQIADYPFTTLVPNLGMVPYHDQQSFVVADIPGIIEGAHEGRGLGHRFLRHIERNSVLLFMIPVDSDDPLNEFDILLKELELYNPELLDKKRLLAISKADLLNEEETREWENRINEWNKDVGSGLALSEAMLISSHTQTGIARLKDRLWQALTNS